MKKVFPLICITFFLVGIAMILTADTGLIASYPLPILAGTIISIFSGILLCIYFHQVFRNK